MELLKVENIERFQDVSIMVRQLKPSRKQDMNNYMIAVKLELYLHVILVWIKKTLHIHFGWVWLIIYQNNNPAMIICIHAVTHRFSPHRLATPLTTVRPPCTKQRRPPVGAGSPHSTRTWRCHRQHNHWRNDSHSRAPPGTDTLPLKHTRK